MLCHFKFYKTKMKDRSVLQAKLKEEAEDNAPLSELQARMKDEAEDNAPLSELLAKMKDEAEDNAPLSELQAKMKDEAEDSPPHSEMQAKMEGDAEDNAPLSELKEKMQKEHFLFRFKTLAEKRPPIKRRGGFYLCPPIGEAGFPPDEWPFYLIQLQSSIAECNDADGDPQYRCKYLVPAQVDWSDEDMVSGRRFTSLQAWLTTPWLVAPWHASGTKGGDLIPEGNIKQELSMKKFITLKRAWRIAKTGVLDTDVDASQCNRRAGGLAEAKGWARHFITDFDMR